MKPVRIVLCYYHYSITTSLPRNKPRGGGVLVRRPQQEGCVWRVVCFYTDGHSGDMKSAPSVTQKSLCLRHGTTSSLFMSRL